MSRTDCPKCKGSNIGSWSNLPICQAIEKMLTQCQKLYNEKALFKPLLISFLTKNKTLSQCFKLQCTKYLFLLFFISLYLYNQERIQCSDKKSLRSQNNYNQWGKSHWLLRLLWTISAHVVIFTILYYWSCIAKQTNSPGTWSFSVTLGWRQRSMKTEIGLREWAMWDQVWLEDSRITGVINPDTGDHNNPYTAASTVGLKKPLWENFPRGPPEFIERKPQICTKI